MLLSTLPDLPGRTYDVRGVVFDNGRPYGFGYKKTFLGKMLDNIVQQASGMGADAIIDIKIVADSATFVVTGTAVKLR